MSVDGDDAFLLADKCLDGRLYDDTDDMVNPKYGFGTEYELSTNKRMANVTKYAKHNNTYLNP